MKSIGLWAILLFGVLQTHAQTISGKVYRLGTDAVIAGASVYYGGSMMGTSTDNNGSFQIQAQARQIPIIVSSIGYYSATVTYKQGEPLIVYLKPKTEVLRAVTIRVDGMSRKDEIKLFTKEFIGTSTFARSCTITNIDDIDFFYSKKTKILTASCDKPIIIENKKLGYTISYFLDSFSWTTKNVSFIGNFIFKENIPMPTDSVKVRRNREMAYKNSRMQFIRALWNHQLKKGDFELVMHDNEQRGIKRSTAEKILVADSLHQQYVYLNNNKLYIVDGFRGLTTLSQTEKFSFINKNGFYGAGLQWSGAMAQQRMGDLLPFEYRSEQELSASVDNTPALSVVAVTNEGSPAVVPQVPEIPANLFFEKAYLHTDRDIYGQGEDVWYKAYVVNALDNSAINYSHNLYVELIGPESKLVRRETVRLENGLGNGDFKLAATIPAGRYRLRAYTNWMRNFGDNFIFEKGIIILNTQVASSAATANNVKIKKAATATLSTANSSSVAPTVRFFPEGGSLVEGISSVVAVKAEDDYGKGIPAKGTVLSSSGDTVSRFSCDSLGMGLFVLLPVKGLTYQAIVSLSGAAPAQVRRDNFTFKLPAALSKGMAIQVRQTDSEIRAVINRAGEPLTDTISIVIKHGGKTLLNKRLGLQNLQASVMLPKAYLPEGVSAITLYGHDGKPDCERLIYVHHPGDANKLTIATNKKTYQPKEQVTISIQALPNTSLSLAAVDAAAVPVQPGDIVSYLNLQSEVKGRIENPNRYFDTTNVNRFKQLDMLLLTQGWRDFIWKRLEDATLNPVYQPERGITITGRVRRVGVNTGLPGITVNMDAPKAEGQKVFATTTDSAGRFAIYDARFYGYQYINFLSRRSDKINKDGENKSGTGGYIQVDSLLRDTLSIGPDALMAPTDTARLSDQTAMEMIERVKKSLALRPGHNLEEVTIKANQSRLVTTLPPEIHPITLAEQKTYKSLSQYLLYMIEGAQLGTYHCIECSLDTNKIVPILTQGIMPIMINGIYSDSSSHQCICQNEYLYLQMSDVLKVTINTSYSGYGKNISVDALLRPGVLETKDYFDNTMADMVGYYQAREFYKPKQEEIDNDADTRANTLHWEPNIITNDKGEAVVSFYNTKQTGNIRLVVQGVTANGAPLAITTGYKIN